MFITDFYLGQRNEIQEIIVSKLVTEMEKASETKGKISGFE